MTKIIRKRRIHPLSASVLCALAMIFCVTPWIHGQEADEAAPDATAEAAPAELAEEDLSGVEMMPEELDMDERVRRQELQLLAQEDARNAVDAYQSDDFANAIKLYQSARGKLLKAGQTDAAMAEAASIDVVITQIYVDWADSLAGEAAELALVEQFDTAMEKLRVAYDLELDVAAKQALADRIAEYRNLKKVAAFESQIKEENVDLGREDRETGIDILMAQGKVMLENGRLTDARDKFQEVLTIDPYRLAAIRGLRKVSKELQSSAEERRIMGRATKLAEVSWKWSSPVSAISADGGMEIGTDTVSKIADSAIQKKLREIVIPKIEFEEASIHQVVKFLKQKSKELDPEGEGVNFFLRLKDSGVAGGNGAADTPDAGPAFNEDEWGGGLGGEDWGDGAAPDGGAPAGGDRPAAALSTITMNMDTIQLGEAVKYICLGANLKYRVESNAVVIADRDLPEGDLITKFYPLKVGFFKVQRTASGGGLGGADDDAGWDDDAGAAEDASSPEAVRAWFETMGVVFPEGSTVAYVASSSKLVVTNTEQNLRKIENILRELDSKPMQVMIEAKFVEVNQEDLEGLGMQWALTDGLGSPNARFRIDGQKTDVDVIPQYEYDEIGITVPDDPEVGYSTTWYDSRLTGYERIVKPNDSLFDTAYLSTAVRTLTQALGTGGETGVLSAGIILGATELSALIHAVSQAKSSDLLSAPKVTTVSGQTAIIRMVIERYFPESWTEPDVTTDDGTISITPSMPEYGDAKDIGVVLEVTPQVESDGYTIGLELRPQVNEFLGYDTNNNSQAIIDGVPVEFKAQMPIIEARTIQTNVIIYDGETVVLGGMVREQIEEFSDKIPIIGDVPVVGRFFRNRGERTTKRNLLIFVTARLVDAAGQAKRRQEALGLPDFRP